MKIEDLENLIGITCALFLKARVRWIVDVLHASQEEADDFEQDLLLFIYRHLPDFDSRRASRTTYIARLIQWGSQSLVSHLRSPKRDRTLLRPLKDSILEGEDDRLLGLDDLGEEALARFSTSHPKETDLRIDIQKLVGRLPPQHKRFARVFGQVPLADIARHVGKERTTLYWYRNQIRKKAKTLGLKRYLK